MTSWILGHRSRLPRGRALIAHAPGRRHEPARAGHAIDRGAGPLVRSSLATGLVSPWRSRVEFLRRLALGWWSLPRSSRRRCARHAGGRGGGLVGWVESTRGVPVAGALVSCSARDPRRQPRDARRQRRASSRCPRCPPGSYTLRALGHGHEPSAARHVTVLPNHDALFTLSLTPVSEKADDARRERHEATRQPGRVALARPPQAAVGAGDGRPRAARAADDGKRPSLATPMLGALGALDGSVELAATVRLARPCRSVPAASARRWAWARCSCRAASPTAAAGPSAADDRERERDWRMAAEFVLEPGGGHEIQAGAGYGARDGRAALAADAGRARPRARAALRPGPLADRRPRHGHDGRALLVPRLPRGRATTSTPWSGSSAGRRRAASSTGPVSTRTLAPGGDLLTLSTVSASPAITLARLEDGLRPERVVPLRGRHRPEARPRARTSAPTSSPRTMHDRPMLTVFEGGVPFVSNAGTLDARGFG